MIKLLTGFLFNPENNLDSSGYQLLFHSGVKVNKSTFIDRLHEHPEIEDHGAYCPDENAFVAALCKG